MRFFTQAIALLISAYSFAQSPDWRTHLITETQKAIVPIICHDSASGRSTGTGVVLQTAKGYALFLTCEHVIAVKDSNGKTVRYKDKVFVNINDSLNTVATSYRCTVIYSNDSLDFALLALHLDFAPPSYLRVIQRSRWKTNEDLRDGESVLYCGYPMGIGIRESNHPLSRMGMISQIDTSNSYFIVDGFVQHGHSGSPVFLVRQERNVIPESWNIYLIGLMKAYPTDRSMVYEDVKLRERESLIALTNSGFSYVVPMNEIIKAIEHIESTWE